MVSRTRLLQALELLKALGPLRDDPDFASGYTFALEEAKVAVREYTGQLPTLPATPAAKRGSNPPPLT